MISKKITTPVLITIFGAKGDLTRRKLIPALYNLNTGNHLPEIFTIYCVDYLATDEKVFKDDLLAGVNQFSRTGVAEKNNGMNLPQSFITCRAISRSRNI
jgi:glucose-6-phosphate 1-dehydrogenase